MGTYLRPCGNVGISSSWQDHKNRTPPSAEPGTDYAVGVGTTVHAVTDGIITEVKTNTSGAMGRVAGMRHDDGNYTRHLHLSAVSVAIGQRVARGDIIALSGASANGSENGVGAHVHTTMWIGQPWISSTVDFERYVGEEEDMALSDTDVQRVADAVWAKSMSGGDPLSDGEQVPQETAAERIRQVRRSTYGAGGRLLTITESVKYGKQGVRTDGDLTAVVKRIANKVDA